MSNDDILFRLMRLKFFKNFKHNNNNKGHIPYSCLFAICRLMKLRPVTWSCNIIEIFLIQQMLLQNCVKVISVYEKLKFLFEKYLTQ